jgi:hypothetical protein
MSRLLLEDTDRIQCPKCWVLNKKKNRPMDDVEKLNNCINIPSLQTLRLDIIGFHTTVISSYN